jgi:hypothetical protein
MTARTLLATCALALAACSSSSAPPATTTTTEPETRFWVGHAGGNETQVCVEHPDGDDTTTTCAPCYWPDGDPSAGSWVECERFDEEGS